METNGKGSRSQEDVIRARPISLASAAHGCQVHPKRLRRKSSVGHFRNLHHTYRARSPTRRIDMGSDVDGDALTI